MKDLEFISGEFFNCQIPKDMQYLLYYFKSDIQLAFLKYYMIVGDYSNFADHTGRFCSKRFVFQLKKRYDLLVDLHKKSKSMLSEESMEIVSLIESGKFVLTHLKE